MSHRVVRVGDRVRWSGGFGRLAAEECTVARMELTMPGAAHGQKINEADEELMKSGRVIFDLNNGHWAYGYQIELIEESSGE